jgi:hypothetical protein
VGQGDQIGRIFAQQIGRFFILASFFRVTKEAKILGPTFFRITNYVICNYYKNGWASFWAIFSQTHPVTLVLAGISSLEAS